MEQRTNGMSIAGMVLGIVSLLVSFIPCIGVFAAVLAIIGLILSALGYKSAKDQAGPTTMAIVGMVLSILAIIIAILWGTMLAKATKDIQTDDTTYTTCQEAVDAYATMRDDMKALESNEEPSLGDLSKIMSYTTKMIKISTKLEELECRTDSAFSEKIKEIEKDIDEQ